MQNLRARAYDPANGRFIGLDPFAGNMQDPQSLHKYAYVHGDPIGLTDPTGMFGLGGMVASIGIGLGNVATELVTGGLILGLLEYAAKPAFDVRLAGLLMIADGNIEQGFELYNLGNRILGAVFSAIEMIDTAIGVASLGLIVGMAAVKLASRLPEVADSLLSLKVSIFKKPPNELYGSAYLIGRADGVVVSPQALDNLAPYGVLDRFRDTFTRIQISDAVLDAKSAATGRTVNGLFEVLPNGEMLITIRSDATYYELLHEMQHYEDAVELGPRNWVHNRKTFGEQWAEQRAYDRFKKSEHWQHLSAAEKQNAVDNVIDAGGTP